MNAKRSFVLAAAAMLLAVFIVLVGVGVAHVATAAPAVAPEWAQWGPAHSTQDSAPSQRHTWTFTVQTGGARLLAGVDDVVDVETAVWARSGVTQTLVVHGPMEIPGETVPGYVFQYVDSASDLLPEAGDVITITVINTIANDAGLWPQYRPDLTFNGEALVPAPTATPTTTSTATATVTKTATATPTPTATPEPTHTPLPCPKDRDGCAPAPYREPVTLIVHLNGSVEETDLVPGDAWYPGEAGVWDDNSGAVSPNRPAPVAPNHWDGIMLGEADGNVGFATLAMTTSLKFEGIPVVFLVEGTGDINNPYLDKNATPRIWGTSGGWHESRRTEWGSMYPARWASVARQQYMDSHHGVVPAVVIFSGYGPWHNTWLPFAAK